MARDENPPFARGETFYNGDTIDATDLGGEHLEGKEWVFEDVHPETGVVRTGRSVRCRVVRNTAAIALLPARLASFEASDKEYGSRIDGYATTLAAECYPIDEYLPTTGVVVNDLCYIVVEGPSEVKTNLAGDATNVFSAGSWGVAATAATSGATTAGRVEVQVLTGATAALANQVMNRIGRALTARTTNNTDTDTLFDIGHW
jgi:hypothetical protein